MHGLHVDSDSMAPRGARPCACAAGGFGATLGWLGGSGALGLAGLDVLLLLGPMPAALGGAAVGASIGVVAGAALGIALSALEQRQDRRRLRQGCRLLRMRVRCAGGTARAEREAGGTLGLRPVRLLTG